METFQNKMGLKCCIWSSLNAPGTENPLCHPFLGLGEFRFSLLAVWGNKNWPPSMRVRPMNKGAMAPEISVQGCVIFMASKWPQMKVTHNLGAIIMTDYA